MWRASTAPSHYGIVAAIHGLLSLAPQGSRTAPPLARVPPWGAIDGSRSCDRIDALGIRNERGAYLQSAGEHVLYPVFERPTPAPKASLTASMTNGFNYLRNG